MAGLLGDALRESIGGLGAAHLREAALGAAVRRCRAAALPEDRARREHYGRVNPHLKRTPSVP